MGNLAKFLQDSFAERCPDGWRCEREKDVLDGRLAKLFGYSPQADIMLERLDGSRRLWIEFEVSRADPVANHAKFATAHLFQPQLSHETFISMVSSHIATGRRNLAANTIYLMRHIGMSAFQTTLLPAVPPAEISRLNGLAKLDLGKLNLPTEAEVARAIRVSEPISDAGRHRVYFASHLLEVMCSLQYWNRAVLSDESRQLWGRRRVQYFVFDPTTRSFAPSKFCAFRPISIEVAEAASATAANMTIEVYASLDEGDPRFDGNRAWRHLCDHLGMSLADETQCADISRHFEVWLNGVREAIQLNGKGPKFLIPPRWFQ